jgi:uncharacterized RDD family membrane protein YckC
VIVLNVVALPINFLVLVPLMVTSASGDAAPEEVGGAMIAGWGMAMVLGWLLSWFYFAFMESSSRQATLGKMAIGVRVTDLDGRPVSFARATGRYFAKILSNLTLGIGHLMVAFTERKQGLHDMVAGTLVVRGAP